MSRKLPVKPLWAAADPWLDAAGRIKAVGTRQKQAFKPEPEDDWRQAEIAEGQ